MDTIKLTARQQQILELIQTAIQNTGAPPTRAEIAHELGAEIVEIVVLLEIGALEGRKRIIEKFPEISIRAIVID
jgi:SOS-response transcriptional repressor LexA